MKQHTTNYQNTLIAISEDCPTFLGEEPPSKKEQKTLANLQYDLIKNNPYQYTSDEILFELFAAKNNLSNKELPTAKEHFFSKGQPCLRCSPLAKRYGWGIHHNHESKIALVSCDSTLYQ
jgi:hypothetical protein